MADSAVCPSCVAIYRSVQVCPECGIPACTCDGCADAAFTVFMQNPIEMPVVGERGLWCTGPEEDEALILAVAATAADEKIAGIAEPTAGVVPFRALARACGLTTADIEQMTGKASSVRKKSAGRLQMTGDDEAFFRGVWARIKNGDVEGLPAGCREVAWALRTLS